MEGMSKNTMSSGEALIEQINAALDRLPDKVRKRLAPYRETYGMANGVKLVLDYDSTVMWLTCDRPPAGVTFRLPRRPARPSQEHKHHHRISIFFDPVLGTSPLNQDRCRDVYEATAEQYTKAGNPFSQLPALRAALAAIEEEDQYYRERLDKEADDFSKVMNACFRLLTEEIIDAGHPIRVDKMYTKYMSHNYEARSSCYKDGRSRVDAERHRLQKLSEIYSRRRLAALECVGLSSIVSEDLVGWAEPRLGGQRLETKWRALADFFDLPELLFNTTLVGFLHYARTFISLLDKLEFLNCKYIAYKVIQRAVIFDQKLPLWEEVRSRLGPPYEDETMQDSATSPFSANAVWHRWGRFIVNRRWELEREGVITRTEQARHIRNLLAAERHDELERVGVSAADFGPKQLDRVLAFHRETGFDADQ